MNAAGIQIIILICFAIGLISSLICNQCQCSSDGDDCSKARRNITTYLPVCSKYFENATFSCTETCTTIGKTGSCVIWKNSTIYKKTCSSLSYKTTECAQYEDISQCYCTTDLCNQENLFKKVKNVTTPSVVKCLSNYEGNYLTSEDMANCEGTSCAFSRFTLGPQLKQSGQYCSKSAYYDEDLTSEEPYAPFAAEGCVAVIYKGYHTDGIYPKHTILCRCKKKLCNEPVYAPLQPYSISSNPKCAMTTFRCTVADDPTTCNIPGSFQHNECDGEYCFLLERREDGGTKYEMGCIYANTTNQLETGLQWRSGFRTSLCAESPTNIQDDRLKGSYSETGTFKLACNMKTYIDLAFGDQETFLNRFDEIKDLSPAERYFFSRANHISAPHTLDYNVVNTEDVDYYYDLYQDIYDIPPKGLQKSTEGQPQMKPSFISASLPCVFSKTGDCQEYYNDPYLGSYATYTNPKFTTLVTLSTSLLFINSRFQ